MNNALTTGCDGHIGPRTLGMIKIAGYNPIVRNQFSMGREDALKFGSVIG